MRIFLLSIFVVFTICAPVMAITVSETIPEDAVCLLLLRIRNDDPGVQWVLNSYKKWFLSEKIGPAANNIIQDFDILEFSEIAGGLIPDENRKPNYLLAGDMNETDASVTFKYKDLNFKLKIKEREEAKGLQHGIVKSLLDQWMAEKDLFEDIDGIVYSKARSNKGQICSYAFVNNRVIIGSSYSLVKEAKRASSSAGKSAGAKRDLSKVTNGLDKNDDGYLFVDNKDGYLSAIAKKQEAMWHIPVLLSDPYVESLTLYFNIIDKGSINARAVFQSNDPAKLGEIEVDAVFIAEFIRRKLMLKKIDISYTIENSKDSVILKMSFRNLELYLREFLKVDKIAVK